MMTEKQRLACEVRRQINLKKRQEQDRMAQLIVNNSEELKPIKAPDRLTYKSPIDGMNGRLTAVIKWSFADAA